MELRKITIVSSSSQSRKEIMSAATTLAELKSDLNAAGISYNGMTFMEGYSKTEMKDDASVLPTNVPTKNGKTTNELVFMLTAPQKKIKSGAMSRAECYTFMKNHPQEAAAFKAKYGKNYTNATTVDLAAFITVNMPRPAQQVETSKHTTGCAIIENAKAFAKKLLEKSAISETNFNSLIAVLDGSVNESVDESLSDDELTEMFEFARD